MYIKAIDFDNDDRSLCSHNVAHNLSDESTLSWMAQELEQEELATAQGNVLAFGMRPQRLSRFY